MVKLFVVFAKTLQYSYLFGIVPTLMMARWTTSSPTSNGSVRCCAGDRRRVSFIAAELMYGSRGPDSGVLQFILYGLVGFVPGDGLVGTGARGDHQPATA